MKDAAYMVVTLEEFIVVSESTLLESVCGEFRNVVERKSSLQITLVNSMPHGCPLTTELLRGRTGYGWLHHQVFSLLLESQCASTKAQLIDMYTNHMSRVPIAKSYLNALDGCV